MKLRFSRPWIIFIFTLLLVGFSIIAFSFIRHKPPLFGFIDLHGEWVIKPQFRCAMSFSEGYASVTFTGEWCGERWGGQSGA